MYGLEKCHVRGSNLRQIWLISLARISWRARYHINARWLLRSSLVAAYPCVGSVGPLWSICWLCGDGIAHVRPLGSSSFPSQVDWPSRHWSVRLATVAVETATVRPGTPLILPRGFYCTTELNPTLLTFMLGLCVSSVPFCSRVTERR